MPNRVNGGLSLTGDRSSYLIGQTEIAARALQPALYLVATP
ncbi:MAG: rRNA (cytidine-2'-O-)-methyltransferase, partial [Mesorhizobium sp.]